MTKDIERALEGAEFLHPAVDVEEEIWSRDSSDYNPTNKFIQRMKELRGIVTGDDINDAFQYGELVEASQDCVAFTLFKEGYTISIIVRPTRGSKDEVVSVWPFIYSEDEVRETGSLSSKQMWRIEEYVGEHKSSWNGA